MGYRRFHHCLSIPFSLNLNCHVVVVSGCCSPLREKCGSIKKREPKMKKKTIGKKNIISSTKDEHQNLKKNITCLSIFVSTTTI